ncbi:hypothetical protein [Alienimonas chondri]|uniref:DUF4064 domain-containing protein n=1 Tax=Alienimonas chondri TaxID=2681879 RepID=A0ABX1VDH8_9PLAN|nr:hypothetical protein [Alienimonas chondri]NNJ25476.1 hypothetical protein [Alienimonas chondri]
MSIPETCPMCGSSHSHFRVSRSTGRTQCSVCGEAIATSEAPRGRGARSTEDARRLGPGSDAERAKGPAIGLLVVGAMSAAATLFVILACVMAAVENPTPQNLDPAGNVAAQMVGYYAAMLSGPVSSLTMTLIILFGGYQMLTARSWAWALVGTIAAMVPCCNFTFLFGIPIGIWALVVLLDPQVKAAFR